MVLDVVGVLASLAIALTSVAFSHYIAQKIKFKSNLRGLVTELKYNLEVLEDIRVFLMQDEEAEREEGKQAVVTFPRPCRFAFDYFVVEGHLLKVPEKVRKELLDIYRSFDIINWLIDHYLETKYGILYVTDRAVEMRRAIRATLTGQVIVTERMVKNLLKAI